MSRTTRIAGLAAALLAAAATAQEVAPKSESKRPEIYDPRADTTEQLARATAKASRDRTRVLVMFGGNWCGWCHKLHDLFRSDREIAGLLRDEYQLVLVDTEAPGAAELLGRCKAALDAEELAKGVGYPFLAVLDAGGSIVTAQRTDPLEEGDHHHPGRVKAFLAEHKAPQADARVVLKEALRRAASEDRMVFLHFGAPWCGWCHRLEDWMARPEVAEVLARDFLDVKIDTDRMEGGQEVLKEYCPSPGGIPWFAFLSPEGVPIVTSDGPRGNVGFPVEPFEIEHFAAMLRKAARRIEPGQIEGLERSLRESAERIRAPRPE